MASGFASVLWLYRSRKGGFELEFWCEGSGLAHPDGRTFRVWRVEELDVCDRGPRACLTPPPPTAMLGKPLRCSLEPSTSKTSNSRPGSLTNAEALHSEPSELRNGFGLMMHHSGFRVRVLRLLLSAVWGPTTYSSTNLILKPSNSSSNPRW